MCFGSSESLSQSLSSLGQLRWQLIVVLRVGGGFQDVLVEPVTHQLVNLLVRRGGRQGTHVVDKIAQAELAVHGLRGPLR